VTYRVCIPTAGTGSRLGSQTQFINKSLVSVANKPVLAHLIEQFPADVEFAVALGHKGNLVREFLQNAYPERSFFFAEAVPFEGPGSGLGLSLLACKQYLQQPFVFVSCDTLVDEQIPAPDHNWMGYGEAADLTPYRTIAIDAGNVTSICEKGEGQPHGHRPYIGLAGIHDYRQFWMAMERGGDHAIHSGEAFGLRAVLPQGIKAHAFTWHDTGTPNALMQTREHYRDADAPTILEKPNEAIWFVGDNVIKFSDDEKFIANRVMRARELSGFVPAVTGATPHMYRYRKISGEVVSRSVTLPLFERLLAHCQSFWRAQPLPPDSANAFRQSCIRFYRDKTYERLALFYATAKRSDGTESINGRPMPTLSSLLDAVDWNWLAEGRPGRFHGDFHFENILWRPVDQSFAFLDWRQDFGGDLSTGDIYYDLAKLLHGLIICHELIAANHFRVEWAEQEISFDFLRKQMLVDCERQFAVWIRNHDYDLKRVYMLTALIFLNISPLHHHPYSLLLYTLGKQMLESELDR
jgi:hypothetical protein